MAHEETERAIRELLGHDRTLAERVIRKLRKKRAGAKHQRAVDEITQVNGGYFILPRQLQEEHLTDDGPEQLRLDFGTHQ